SSPRGEAENVASGERREPAGRHRLRRREHDLPSPGPRVRDLFRRDGNRPSEARADIAIPRRAVVREDVHPERLELSVRLGARRTLLARTAPARALRWTKAVGPATARRRAIAFRTSAAERRTPARSTLRPASRSGP